MKKKWNKNSFSIYTSEEDSVLGLVKELGEYTSEAYEELESKTELVVENLENKTDLNGDHKGSWQGLSRPTLSEEGMRATVEKLDEDTKNILNEYCYVYKDVTPSIPTNHLLVYNLFDSLVNKYPTDVSSTLLGTDSVGNEIKAYTFTNTLVTNNNGERVDRGTILITCCVHGDERSTATQLYYFLKDLVESEPPSLLYDFKAKYRIKVIPICNPSGYDAETRQNSNKVDIARNFNANWVLKGNPGDYEYSGATAESEKETKLIQNYINLNLESELLIDIHNTAQGSIEYRPERYNQFTWINTPTKDSYFMKELRQPYQTAILNCSKLWSNRHSELDKNVVFGMYDNFNLANVTEYGMIKNIKSVQLEIPWKISKLDTEKFAKNTVKIGIEMIGNLLINYYKDLKLLSEDKTYMNLELSTEQTATNGGVFLIPFDKITEKTNNVSLSYSGIVVPKGFKKVTINMTVIFDKAINGLFENRIYIAQDKSDRTGTNKLSHRDTRTITGSNSIERVVTSSFVIDNLKTDNVIYLKTVQISTGDGLIKGAFANVFFE